MLTRRSRPCWSTRITTALVLILGLLAAVTVSATRAPVADAQLTVEQVNAQLGVGVNLGNALEGPREGVWGLTLREDFFPTIAQAGFDHVRVPIRFSAYADQTAPFTIPNGVDPSVPNANNLWERIDWVIANAEANGLYVIVDLHHYDELFDNVAGERDRFLAMWEQIATRYADAGPLVLFELLNEPHGQFNDDPELLNMLLADALATVRATNPTRPVLVGPVQWNSINSLGALELPDDNNLIVSVHFYEPFAFTHQGATWLDPVPPSPVTFDAELVNFGAGWGNWSWDTSTVATATGLRVSFDRQWAGLGFGRPSLVDPASLNITVAGDAELSVRCTDANAVDVEADRVITSDASSTFSVDMASCPDETQSISFMAASPSFDELVFTNVELCDASGACTNMIESGSDAIDSAFEAALLWSETNDRPINVGEFGAYSAEGRADLNERAEWTEVVRRAGRSRGFSMSYWEFGAGFGVYDPATNTWVTSLVDSLGVSGANPTAAVCRGRTVTIDMNLGASGVGTPGDDVILGTPGDDMIDAGDGDDTVCAGDGDDVVVGGAGGDDIYGEGGRDVLRGGPGVDNVFGGDGNDRVLGGIGDDRLDGGEGDDYLGGFGGADTITGGPGDERIFGGFGPDVIAGGPGNDVISGLIGDDIIVGGSGDDTLNGDRGNDVIDGDAGNDTINGGNANDILSGGAGEDSVNGGRADDQLSGGADNDTCVGNKQNIADTTDGTCELEFGIP